jgi:hypothetical protein
MSNGNPIDSASLTDDGWTLGNIETENLLKKITSIGQPLETYVNGAIYYGIKTGLNKAFIIDENTKNKLIQADSKNAAIIKPFLIGKDISRYFPIKSNKFVIYLPWHFPLNDDPAITGASSKSENAFKQAYPAIYQYLLQFKDELLKRNAAETGIRYEWYTLQRFGSFYSKDFEKNKICWGNLSSESPFTIDDGGHYINAPACFLISDDILYLLGCLNSSLLWWTLKNIAAGRRGGFIEAKPMYVSKLPIRSINFAEPVDKARHDRMVTLVTQMLDLNKKLQEARLEQDKTMLSRQIEVTDVTIDRLVYELYGITEEEIKLVEEMVK